MLNEKLIGDCQDINDNRSGILNHERTHIKIVGFTFHYKREAKNIYIRQISRRSSQMKRRVTQRIIFMCLNFAKLRD